MRCSEAGCGIFGTRAARLALLLFLAGGALTGGAGAQVPTAGDPLGGLAEVQASKGLAAPAVASDDPAVARGRYLVGLLGCASCHTDGALVGQPDPARALAGSSIGIAYTNPMQQRHPGVVYPGNLTPDGQTGLGDWSEDDIVAMLRGGMGRHGRQRGRIMPWVSYAQLADDDALAIARYLKALPPVSHRVPYAVEPGTPAQTPIVHVGLYRRN
jgi:mono/diheme cytochrome c family protein